MIDIRCALKRFRKMILGVSGEPAAASKEAATNAAVEMTREAEALKHDLEVIRKKSVNDDPLDALIANMISIRNERQL